MKVLNDHQLDERINSFLTRKFEQFPELTEQSKEDIKVSAFTRFQDLIKLKSRFVRLHTT